MKPYRHVFSLAGTLLATFLMLPTTTFAQEEDRPDVEEREESDTYDLYDRNREERNFNPYNYPDEEKLDKTENPNHMFYYREEGPYHIHHPNQNNQNQNRQNRQIVNRQNTNQNSQNYYQYNQNQNYQQNQNQYQNQSQNQYQYPNQNYDNQIAARAGSNLYDRNREERNYNPYSYPDEEQLNRTENPNHMFYYRQEPPYHTQGSQYDYYDQSSNNNGYYYDYQ